ncbi:MAG: Gfo/Idh/MocA family protein, partial [Chitinophagaceae bacterium]
MTTRRNFLQTLSAPVFAIPFLPKNQENLENQVQTTSNPDDLPFEKSTSDKVLRVALMGLGSYANRVAEAMRQSKRAVLVGVISGTPSKIKDWQSKFNIDAKNCYNYENFDQVKNNPDIDAIYVCTPNAMHHPNVLKIAAAGKHAITEKPMAVNAKEGKEMVDACNKAGVKLLVGYRMHFEPKTLEIIRQRDAGDFGKILFFQGLMGFIIGDPTQWRLNRKLAGGGAMMDIGIYAINGSRYMIGEDPVWVTAQEVKTNFEK